jgi:putative ABC transport system permease protein
MDKLLQDLRYALRSLFRQPSFAVTAILTLALGIGATTAIFSVVNAVLLRPLPFERSDRIVAVTTFWTRTGTRGTNVSAPDFHDLKAQNQSFQAMGYFAGGETSVMLNGAADYAVAYRITPGFLEALSARAAVGRLLTADEQTPGGPLAAVITDAFWKRQFNGDRSVIGSTMKFADRIFTVAGVLPSGFRYPARADIYVPAWVQRETTSRSGHNYRVIARLRDGVSVQQARMETTAISTRLQEQYPDTNEGKLAEVILEQRTVLPWSIDALPNLVFQFLDSGHVLWTSGAA